MDKPKESIWVNYREGLKKARIELFKKPAFMSTTHHLTP